MQNYRSILINSFKLTITNKFLWLFGLFSGLFVSKNILRLLVEIYNKISNLGTSWIAYKETVTNSEQIITTIKSTIINNTTSINQGFLTGAFIFIFFIIAAIIAVFSEIIILDNIFTKINNHKLK